jgi:hypothetical protein
MLSNVFALDDEAFLTLLLLYELLFVNEGRNNLRSQPSQFPIKKARQGDKLLILIGNVA